MYTVQDGRVYKSAKTLPEATLMASNWSTQSRNVISIMQGEHTYSWYYRGREMTGKEVENVWKMQEVM